MAARATSGTTIITPGSGLLILAIHVERFFRYSGMGQEILRAGELWKTSDWSVWLRLDGPLLEDSGLMHTQRKHSTFYIHLANEHTDTSTGPADMICKYTGDLR